MRKIEELEKEMKHGNKEACIKLIEPMRSDLYRIALSKLGNEEDAKDAVQETIIKIYLAIQSGKDIKNFKSYITTILINECKSIYKERKRIYEIDQKYLVDNETVNYFDDELSFDEMIDNLEGKAKEVFDLHYKYGLKTKIIAKRLGLSESNVKTILNRGRVKLRKLEKRTTVFMAILCVLIATSVIAISLVKYIQGLFELDSMGKNNDGVQMAIEHMDWYQDIDMEYIDLGKGYKMRAEYLLMDEMNLYMVLDVKAEEDMSKFTDVSLPDLKIIDDNSEVIYDEQDIFAEYYTKAISVKTIENNKNNIKFLVYLYTDSFPISRALDISFSKITFLSKRILGGKQLVEIPAKANFRIELSDKFINRKYIDYVSEDSNIEKAIITETGFYAIVTQDWNENINDVYLVDKKGETYKCYWYYLTDNDNINSRYIILTDFLNQTEDELKIIINGKEFKLRKEN